MLFTDSTKNAFIYNIIIQILTDEELTSKEETTVMEITEVKIVNEKAEQYKDDGT